MALPIPLRINRLKLIASSGSSFLAAGGVVVVLWILVNIPLESVGVISHLGEQSGECRRGPVGLTSEARLPLAPKGSEFIFSADPQAFLILPNATRTSPLVNIPFLPVPFSFEICSEVRSEFANLSRGQLWNLFLRLRIRWRSGARDIGYRETRSGITIIVVYRVCCE